MWYSWLPPLLYRDFEGFFNVFSAPTMSVVFLTAILLSLSRYWAHASGFHLRYQKFSLTSHPARLRFPFGLRVQLKNHIATDMPASWPKPASFRTFCPPKRTRNRRARKLGRYLFLSPVFWSQPKIYV